MGVFCNSINICFFKLLPMCFASPQWFFPQLLLWWWQHGDVFLTPSFLLHLFRWLLWYGWTLPLPPLIINFCYVVHVSVDLKYFILSNGLLFTLIRMLKLFQIWQVAVLFDRLLSVFGGCFLTFRHRKAVSDSPCTVPAPYSPGSF